MLDFSKPPVTNQLRIHLKLKLINFPQCRLQLNDTVYLPKASLELVHLADLLKPIVVRIWMQDKVYGGLEQAIEIEHFAINDFSIIPNYIHHATYTNDQNFSEPTTYLGFNGLWEFLVPDPWYHWKHKVTGQGWLLF